MTSQRVERTWIRMGGYGRFRGKWVKTAIVLPYYIALMSGLFTKIVHAWETFIFYFTNQKQKNYQ